MDSTRRWNGYKAPSVEAVLSLNLLTAGSTNAASSRLRDGAEPAAEIARQVRYHPEPLGNGGPGIAA
jgi:hypothetical protein